jgi:hypothetical protein
MVTDPSNVTLYENVTRTGIIPPHSFTYFSFVVTKSSFKVQVELANATIVLRKGGFPTLSQYTILKNIHNINNISVSLCDYIDIHGTWYIGIYPFGDTQRFSVKAFYDNYVDPVVFIGDSAVISSEIYSSAFQYYAMNVPDYFLGTPSLVRISINETSANITDSILLLAKFNSCPSPASANYGSQMYRGHSTLLVPVRNTGYLVVGVKSSMNTSYSMSISIGKFSVFSQFFNV